MNKIVTSWLGASSIARKLFKPNSAEELQAILAYENPMPIGAASNILYRSPIIEKPLIKLGSAFNEVHVYGTYVIAKANVLCKSIASLALEHSLEGAEFLIGIPGTIGGAVAMNAGCFGFETKDVLISFDEYRSNGAKKIYRHECDMGYRSHKSLHGIVTTVILKFQYGDKNAISAKMAQHVQYRNEYQPIKQKTCGSTFKNPEPRIGLNYFDRMKAWQLIDAVGARGMRHNDAGFSFKHCNFMINYGNADGEDFFILGEKVREMVLKSFNVLLEWEILII